MVENHEKVETVLLTRLQVAKKCGCSVRTIDSWRSQGMPSVGRGAVVRFIWEEVVAWMKLPKVRVSDADAGKPLGATFVLDGQREQGTAE